MERLDHSLTRRRFLAWPCALTLAACANDGKRANGGVMTWQDRSDVLRARLPEIAEFAAETIPGFAVAVILDAQVAWSQGYGVRSFGDQEPVDEETVFEFGSLSKPLFTCAVLRLRDQGVLELDRPLVDYYDYPDVRGQSAASRVTARDVLSHKTGLPNWRPFPPGSALEFIAEPGEGFSYSGEGFFWLQRVVEKLTKTPAAMLLRREAIEPASMSRSSFVFQERMSANHAKAHLRLGTPPQDGQIRIIGERFRRIMQLKGGDLEDVSYDEARDALIADDPTLAPTPSPVVMPPNVAGSLVSTAADYARFMTAFMPGASLSLLSRDSLNEVLAPQTELNGHVSIGLGWRLERTGNSNAFWHSGYNDGFHSYAFGDAQGRFGVVVVTNSDRGSNLRWPVVNGLTGVGEAALLS